MIKIRVLFSSQVITFCKQVFNGIAADFFLSTNYLLDGLENFNCIRNLRGTTSIGDSS